MDKRVEDVSRARVQAGAEPGPERQLTQIQARRLAALSGVAVDSLVGHTIAALAEKYRWEIDPELFLFRRICGRVVKKNPVTGIDYGVPGATVHVLDTEDEYWGFFPFGWLWGWLFPFGRTAEEITSTVTDDCGNFCVWIPRFDIDWVVRWREERYCFPEFLVRPSIANLLRQTFEAEPKTPFPPNPNPPDPPSLANLVTIRADIATQIGSRAQQVLETQVSSAAFGASSAALTAQLGRRAFSQQVPPPLPERVRELHARGEMQALVKHVGITAEHLPKVDFNRYLGPFLRCIDVLVPEWYPIVESPDIAFHVTQDVNGDGIPDTIYDGGFDVPWALFPIPQVTLEASPIAVASPAPECGGDPLPCTDTPEIQQIGLMPLQPAYINISTGLATRPNQPRNGGTSSGVRVYPSTAPFCGELQLYGCNHLEGAQYYRVMVKYAAGSGIPTPSAGAFGPYQPLLATWPVWRYLPAFTPGMQSPDPAGWYPVLDDSYSPVHLLADWTPPGDGIYNVYIEVADAGHTVIGTSPAITFVYNNTAPIVAFDPSTFGWRVAGSGSGFTPLPLSCAIISRLHRDLEIQIGVNVTSNHLRSVTLDGATCGGSALTALSGTTDWWYQNPGDTSFSTVATFTIPGTAQAGCYAFSVDAVSRAFNPAGSDGGFALNYIYDPVWRYSIPSVTVAIID
jgi:hypothetical protein